MQGGSSPAPLEPGAQDGFPAWSGSFRVRFQGRSRATVRRFFFCFSYMRNKNFGLEDDFWNEFHVPTWN